MGKYKEILLTLVYMTGNMNMRSILKKCAIMFSIFILTQCTSAEVKREYYKNGNLKTEGTFLDGLRNGEMLSYDSNGILRSQQNYLRDTLDGKSITYHENGSIETIAYYNGGVLNGEFLKYFPDSNISEKGFYKDGLYLGHYYQYDPYDSGKLVFDSYFVNVDGESVKYYTCEFDRQGNASFPFRTVIVSVQDSVPLNDTIRAEFEIDGKIPYDSASLIVGEFDDEFKPLGQLDTIVMKDRKASYSKIGKVKGIYQLRGVRVKYLTKVYKDSTQFYSIYGYFEENIKVY
jgi:antitoxin component YwqK of YwqJK toxin-antitoxin module